jgi:hypothetical protein
MPAKGSVAAGPGSGMDESRAMDIAGSIMWRFCRRNASAARWRHMRGNRVDSANLQA